MIKNLPQLYWQETAQFKTGQVLYFILGEYSFFFLSGNLNIGLFGKNSIGTKEVPGALEAIASVASVKFLASAGLVIKGTHYQ